MTGVRPDERLQAARDPEQFREWGHAVDRPARRPSHGGRDAGHPRLESARPRRHVGALAGRLRRRRRSARDRRSDTRGEHRHAPAGYVGHQLAAPLPLTTLGSMVVAVVNGSGAIYELSQAGGACELALSKHLTARLCMPETSGGMIVHGGTIATLTALLAARQARAGFDVWRDGCARRARRWPCWRATRPTTPRPAPRRSWGSDRLVPSRSRATSASACGPTRSPPRSPLRAQEVSGRSPSSRARARRRRARSIRSTRSPQVCADEGLWLHVDAAHGGSAALSPKLAPQLAGIGRADSVVWDLHKTLPFPALASLLAYARARDAYGAFAQQADYLFRTGDAGDENMGTRTLECTRPQLSLVAYLGFATVGADGLRAHVERLWELGRELAATRARERRLRARTGARVQHRVLPPSPSRRARTPMHTRSAFASQSTRAASSTSCRPSCAA